MDQAIEQTQIWDKDAVQALIARSDQALAKALWVIFQNQTADEQAAGVTKHHNKRGFNGRDAAFLSSVASKLPRYDFRMTKRQIAKVRPMMMKYWRQLLDEIARKGKVVDYGRDTVEVSPAAESEIEETDVEMQPLPASPSDRPTLFGAF